MIDQKKINNLLEIIGKIAQNYLENNKGGHIKLLKEKLKDLLTDPIWNEKLILELKNKINKLDLSNEDFTSLWNVIDRRLDEDYSDYVERKTHMFEGKIREYEKRVIKFFVRAGKLKGQNYVLATIIGYLLLHKRDGLTQAQMKELTGLSKGAISENLKLLEASPILKKELIKGTRKYLYSFGGDFSAIASGTSVYKFDANEYAKKFLQSMIINLEPFQFRKGNKILLERIQGILSFLEFHYKLVDLITDSEFIKGLGRENS